MAYRRLRGDLIQVYKIVHELVGIRKEKLFIMANLELGLRGNSFKLQKWHVSLEICKNAFANRVMNHWNKLPNDRVNGKSVNEFKTAVDKDFLNTSTSIHMV